MTQIDLNRYKEFAQAITSTESDDTGAMIACDGKAAPKGHDKSI